MIEELNGVLVRVQSPHYGVMGAGFLVGERQVLTCAHVVSRTLGLLSGIHREALNDGMAPAHRPAVVVALAKTTGADEVGVAQAPAYVETEIWLWMRARTRDLLVPLMPRCLRLWRRSPIPRAMQLLRQKLVHCDDRNIHVGA